MIELTKMESQYVEDTLNQIVFIIESESDGDNIYDLREEVFNSLEIMRAVNTYEEESDIDYEEEEG